MTSNSTYPDECVPYFYIIEHVPSSTLYAGCKFGKNSNPSKFMQVGGYQTSSPTVRRLIVADGLQSFQVKLLLTEAECGGLSVYEYETKFLHDVDAASQENWLNKHNNDIHANGSPRFKQLMLEKTGYEAALQNPNTLHKMQETNLARCGFISNLCDPIARKQWEHNRFIKHGVYHQMHIPEVRERQRTTMVQKHGVKHNFQGDLRKQAEDNREAKYGIGVRNGAQIPGVTERKIKRFEEKFGVSNPMHLPSVIEMKRAQFNEKQNRPIVGTIRQYLATANVRPIDVGLSRKWFNQPDDLLKMFCITHQLTY